METYNYGLIYVTKNILWLFSGQDIDAKFELHHYDSLLCRKENMGNGTEYWYVQVMKGDYTYHFYVKKLNMTFKDGSEPIIPK
jgi:hypothetical protein